MYQIVYNFNLNNFIISCVTKIPITYSELSLYDHLNVQRKHTQTESNSFIEYSNKQTNNQFIFVTNLMTYPIIILEYQTVQFRVITDSINRNKWNMSYYII